MVRTVDPSRTDVTDIAVKSLLSYFQDPSTPLSMHQSKIYLGYFLSDPTLDAQIKSSSGSLSINLRTNCKVSNRFSPWYMDIDHFPAYHNKEDNSLTFCMNLIRNEADLMLNFQREINTLLEPSVIGEEEIVRISKGAYKGCKKGLSPYFKDQELANEEAKNCAFYYTRVDVSLIG